MSSRGIGRQECEKYGRERKGQQYNIEQSEGPVAQPNETKLAVMQGAVTQAADDIPLRFLRQCLVFDKPSVHDAGKIPTAGPGRRPNRNVQKPKEIGVRPGSQ